MIRRSLFLIVVGALLLCLHYVLTGGAYILSDKPELVEINWHWLIGVFGLCGVGGGFYFFVQENRERADQREALRPNNQARLDQQLLDQVQRDRKLAS